MSPIGRPHNPATTPRAGQRGGPGEHAGGAESDRPDAAPPAEDHTAEPGAPVGPSEGPALDPDPATASVEAPPADEPAPTTSGPGEAPAAADALLQELEVVRAERDDYLELARAKQAELENFRKQVTKRQADHLQQAAADLVTKLLPVLDALDNGVGHGDESLVPVRAQLLGVLEKEGLRRVDPGEAPFDPNEHDAVAHEAGDGGEATVAETLRAGYWWNGRLLRPAMVRVRG